MQQRSIIKRANHRLGYEAMALRVFGVSSFKQHLWRLIGRPEYAVRLQGVGPVLLRAAQPDLASFLRIFAGGEYEIPNSIAAAVRARHDEIAASKLTPVIVDAGAYVGAASIFFRNSFPLSHVIAIEPDPESFTLLERNLASVGGTTAVEGAVAAHHGHVQVVHVGESWATRVERSDRGIPVVTMNEAFDMVPNGEPFIAKVNIEGFESELFSDNLEWLDRISLLFIEPHDWLLPDRHSSRSFQRALGEREFKLFIVGPHLCYARL
jgi:FkbM family methyltransferase